MLSVLEIVLTGLTGNGCSAWLMRRRLTLVDRKQVALQVSYTAREGGLPRKPGSAEADELAKLAATVFTGN